MIDLNGDGGLPPFFRDTLVYLIYYSECPAVYFLNAALPWSMAFSIALTSALAWAS